MAFLNKLGKKAAKSDKPTVKKGSGDPKKVAKAAKEAGIKKRTAPEPETVKKVAGPPKRPEPPKGYKSWAEYGAARKAAAKPQPKDSSNRPDQPNPPKK